jgi:ATP-dependent DNA helicase RecG
MVRGGELVTVRGAIRTVESRPLRGGKHLTIARVRDQSGEISLTWFNQPWIKRQLDHANGEIVAFGLVKETGRSLEMSSPEFEFIDEDDDPDEFARIIPVYGLTDGLQQRTIRRAAESALAFADLVIDPLPEEIRKKFQLPSMRWSLYQMHRPDSEEDRTRARERFAFEEFFVLQLGLAMRRAETKLETGIAFPIADLIQGHDSAQGSVHLFQEEESSARSGQPIWDQVQLMLPFTLTSAQRRVIQEIWSDMAMPHPMNRLVQGDVGSGKTAVAACAMLACVRSGSQAALMAPTEILAEQHAANLQRLFAPLNIRVELLVGKLNSKDKKSAAARLASGESEVAIGTHALIQEGITFRSLGLVVIDEQHRFGVLQRKALRDKSSQNPDVLVMTATPIPRTLTMTLYGDLDLSVIDELPPGRKPIKTHWKRANERNSVYEGVRTMIEQGRQAYFVCPLVGDSEKLNVQAAEDLHYRLSREVYPDLRLGLLHGQMKAREKESVMDAFRNHQLDILISTTVIEVGVDVPNASVMVIEDANRFGLSQLHQLRGRVGRGSNQSFCILIAEATNEDTRRRLTVMEETSDGFRIAEEDLRLRGPGVIAGTQQSGVSDFRIADVVRDSRLLEVARQGAMKIIQNNPGLEGAEWHELKQLVTSRQANSAVVAIS